MSPRIILIRHGRSSHVHAGLLNTEQFRAWRLAYETAGILPDEQPPPAVLALTKGAAIVASDAPRAIESAKRLANGADIVVSPLLRELLLEPPNLGRLRLPLLAWAVAYGVRSLLGRPHVTEAEVERAREAADWLAEMAERGPVVAVTHATVRGVIAGELAKLGWRHDAPRRRNHWSAWTFTRD